MVIFLFGEACKVGKNGFAVSGFVVSSLWFVVGSLPLVVDRCQSELAEDSG